MAKQESTVRTLTVAVLVCLVCSVFVAGAAVALKPTQVENRQLDKQRSILAIAGLGEGDMSAAAIKALYAERIKARVVDLQTGTFSEAEDAASFDPLKAAKDPALSDALAGPQDIASIKRRERLSTVYMVETDGQLDTLILPVRGYGLWSTLYGFIAIKGDLNTVVGFGFYQHGETPGLGGPTDQHEPQHVDREDDAPHRREPAEEPAPPHAGEGEDDRGDHGEGEADQERRALDRDLQGDQVSGRGPDEVVLADRCTLSLDERREQPRRDDRLDGAEGGVDRQERSPRGEHQQRGRGAKQGMTRIRLHRDAPRKPTGCRSTPRCCRRT